MGGASREARDLASIEALVAEGQIGRARAAARRFYARYPMSPAIRYLERLTGYHPRPSGP